MMALILPGEYKGQKCPQCGASLEAIRRSTAELERGLDYCLIRCEDCGEIRDSLSQTEYQRLAAQVEVL